MNTKLNSFFETIEELIFNEDKLVTYKWLSNKLMVHTNTAKQLLYAFANKTGCSSLNVTYVLSGFCMDSNEYLIILVNESKLSDVKKKFKTITSEHVYSLQKGNNSSSHNDIFMANNDVSNLGNNKTLSSILLDKETQRDTNPGKSSTDTSSNVTANKNKAVENKIKTQLEQSSIAKVPEDKKPAQSNGSVKESQNKTKSPSPKKNDKKNIKKNFVSKGGEISAFFNRQATSNIKPLNTDSKQEDKRSQDLNDNIKPANKDGNKEQKSNSKRPLEEVENILNITPPNPKKVKHHNYSDENNKKVKSTTVSSSSTKRGKKKKKKQDDSDNDRRKRKRIRVLSDSESSNDELNEEDEEPAPEIHEEPIRVNNTPESDDEVIPPTPVEKGKKRIRKEIDRTFTDDDGFIVTRKEYVYEECSDSEVPNENNQVKVGETESKKPVPVETKETSKTKSPTKNKQSSIMNFFKRK